MKPDREYWVVAFRIEGREGQWPIAVRIRKLLKLALRGFGLRSIAITDAEAKAIREHAERHDAEGEGGAK